MLRKPDDRGHARFGPPEAHPANTIEATGDGRGSCSRGLLPPVGRGPLHHGPDFGRGWRTHVLDQAGSKTAPLKMTEAFAVEALRENELHVWHARLSGLTHQLPRPPALLCPAK